MEAIEVGEVLQRIERRLDRIEERFEEKRIEDQKIERRLERIEERLESMSTRPLAVKRKEAAKAIGLGLTELDRMIGEKEIRVIKRGSRILVPMSELVRFTTPAQHKPSGSRPGLPGPRPRTGERTPEEMKAALQARIRAENKARREAERKG